MTYTVKGRRAAQQDTHQPTQMTRQLKLGGSGGVVPPGQKTALGADYYPEPGASHGGDFHDSQHGTKQKNYY